MKVVYLRRLKLPSRAANAINTFRLCEVMGASGWTVELMMPEADCTNEELFAFYGAAPVFSITQVRSGYRGKGAQIWTALRLAQVAAKRRGYVKYGRDLYTLWFLTLLGQDVYYDAHSPPKHSGWKQKLLASIYGSHRLRGVTIISEALRQPYIEAGVPEENIHLVRNSAKDISSLQRLPPFRAASGRFTVGYTGHLYRGRGVDLILAVAQRLPGVDFVFIGGTVEDIHYWKTTELPPNVQFRGFLPPGKVKEQVVRFDALLAPYQRIVKFSQGKGNQVDYMSPVKLFEYMASGVPVITSRLPVIEEFLNDSMAVLCDPENRQEWEQAIKKMEHNPQFGKDIAMAALQEFRENYSWVKRVSRIEEILNL